MNTTNDRSYGLPIPDLPPLGGAEVIHHGAKAHGCFVPGCLTLHTGEQVVDGRAVRTVRCPHHTELYFRWLWHVDPHAGPADPPIGCRCRDCTAWRAWCLRHGRPVPA